MTAVPLGTFVDGGLAAALNRLFTTYRNFTDLRIRYYDTVSANNFPTTVEGLIEQIRNFPAQMAQIQQGIPLEVTFLQDIYVKSFQYKVLNSILYTITIRFKTGYLQHDK